MFSLSASAQRIYKPSTKQWVMCLTNKVQLTSNKAEAFIFEPEEIKMVLATLNKKRKYFILYQ
jgi:hypothetical protein